METLPTQDVCDGDFSEEDESSQESVVWGRLFPLGDSFVAVGKPKFLLTQHQLVGQYSNSHCVFGNIILFIFAEICFPATDLSFAQDDSKQMPTGPFTQTVK